jgi:ankyrin repeat protein
VTALDLAAKKGLIAVIYRLVQEGALLVQPRDDTAFKTALQCAAFDGEHEAVAALLELGSDVNAVGGTLGSALQAAVSSGSKECITLLLDSGANIYEHNIGKVTTVSIKTSPKLTSSIARLSINSRLHWTGER